MATQARQQSLDMVRGVAILAVLCFHFELRSGVAPIDALLVPAARAGWMGVDLFFVLSGFLVGRLILVETAERGGLRIGRFFTRRAMRLWPALGVYLAMLVLAGQGAMAWPVLLHVQNYAEHVPSHLWSLAVEEHFYLVAAFALPLLARSGTRRLALALGGILVLGLAGRTVAALAGTPLLALQWQTQFRVDSLAFGVLLALFALHRPDGFARLAARRGAWLAAGAAGFALLAAAGDGAFRHTIGFTIAYLASGALILGSYGLEPRGRWAAAGRALAWLGTIAYSLYLWHASIGRVAQELGAASGVTHPLALFAMQAAASIGVAAALFALVERPMMQMRGRSFPLRRSPPLPA